MNKFPSGTAVIAKTGGPKMKVRWYVDNTHVETSWYQENRETSAVFNIRDLEIWDDLRAFDIEVVAYAIESPRKTAQ